MMQITRLLICTDIGWLLSSSRDKPSEKDSLLPDKYSLNLKAASSKIRNISGIICIIGVTSYRHRYVQLKTIPTKKVYILLG